MLLGCEVLTRKGLQRTALASFHTLSMQLYYIFALRSVGTVTKNVRQSLWEGEGNLKWIFEMRGGWGVELWGFSISYVEENKLNSKNWFLFGKVLYCFCVRYCKWYFKLSFSRWKSRDVLYILYCYIGASYLGKTTCLFHCEVTVYTLFNLQIFRFHLEWA